MKTILVGESCQYFPRGDLRRSPVAAMVTGVFGPLICLVTFPPNSHHFPIHDGVRHKDDPYHETHPKHAFENGVWDYIPGDLRRDRSWAQADQEKAAARLLVLHKMYGDGRAAEIAAVMTRETGEEWNHQRVNAVLRSLKKDNA